MPELPEVETVRLGLVPVLVGHRLVHIEARRPNLRFALPERFSDRLAGQLIERLERRAKYMVGYFEGGEALVMHLGMTGRFTIDYPSRLDAGEGLTGGATAGRQSLGDYVYRQGGDARHDHVVFHLAGGARVTYNDARRFGFMVLVAQSELDCHPLFKGLGPEPLGSTFTAAALASRSAGRKVNLKSLLMDQRVVAGLGNIYVSEALHRAGLSPNRGAATLAGRRGAPCARTEVLAEAIRTVLGDAIAAGGSTLRDYRHADGSQGAFQETFFVYGREGEPCRRGGCGGTIRRAVHGGRATFYCPRCQK
ncbi:MAG: bifunctional DNA-formamidopyrimidine glycosylase/DNA-(apurinic or apyrimidinic site) lyase [Hyphomicrobium sp.]